MDQLDKDLIKILQKDGRRSFTTIAEEIKPKHPDTTIRFRTMKLVEDGIVTRFSALVSPGALGYQTAALLKIEIGGHIVPEISKDRTTTFAKELAEGEECLWVAVSKEPMTLYALVMAIDENEIETRVARLRKSPDVAKVTVTTLSGVVKGWEVSGLPSGKR
jgi:DNA-binding Lrp family transcriptional regulator